MKKQDLIFAVVGFAIGAIAMVLTTFQWSFLIVVLAAAAHVIYKKIKVPKQLLPWDRFVMMAMGGFASVGIIEVISMLTNGTW